MALQGGVWLAGRGKARSTALNLGRGCSPHSPPAQATPGEGEGKEGRACNCKSANPQIPSHLLRVRVNCCLAVSDADTGQHATPLSLQLIQSSAVAAPLQCGCSGSCVDVADHSSAGPSRAVLGQHRPSFHWSSPDLPAAHPQLPSANPSAPAKPTQASPRQPAPASTAHTHPGDTPLDHSRLPSPQLSPVSIAVRDLCVLPSLRAA